MSPYSPAALMDYFETLMRLHRQRDDPDFDDLVKVQNMEAAQREDYRKSLVNLVNLVLEQEGETGA